MQSSSLVSTLIRAGAGAGKTTRLINEVYQYFTDFKNEKQVWPRVVLTTFSNKATQEINERLLKKAIETYDTDFFEFINSKSHLLVSTIHGVLHHFISLNQAEFGLTKDFLIVSDPEIARRHQKLFRRVVIEAPEAIVLLETYSLSELFTMIKDYRHFKQSVGALSAYTASSFSEYLRGLRADLISSFRTSIDTLRNNKLTPAWETIVQMFPSLEGDDQQIVKRLIDWNGQIARKPTVAKKCDADLVSAQILFVDGIEKLREYVSEHYHEDFLESYDFTHSLFMSLAEMFSVAVEKDRRIWQEIAISDIETLCLQAKESKSHLFSEFSKKWDFWMIDEFQDTSPIQVSLLDALIGSSRAFFVGDPQQSIYYFRGSDSRVFDSKYQELSESGKVEILAKNYRSQSGVLNFINEFFSRQYAQFQKMEVTKDDLNLDSDVCIYEIENKELSSRLIATQIDAFIKFDPQTPLEQIVVLSRTNKDLDHLGAELELLGIPHFVHTQGQFFRQREVIDLLFLVRFLLAPNDAANLAFLLKTSSVGLSNDEVKSVLAGFKTWKVLSDNAKTMSTKAAKAIQLLEIYTLKSEQVGLLETVQMYAVNESAFVLNHGIDSSGKKESNIWKLFNWLKEQMSRGMDNFLLQMDSVLDPDKNEDFEEAETQAITEPKKIQLMTIHASKGLQFPHVIMIGLDKSAVTRGRFSLDVDVMTKQFSVFIKNKAKDGKIRSPLHSQQYEIQKARESEEFERLLYVALTRAKNRLSLFMASKFREGSWASRLSDFFVHYQNHKDAFTFKMDWIKIDPDAEEVASMVYTQSRSRGADRSTLPIVPQLRTSEFISKIENKMKAKEASRPISFSSSKANREVNLHQILVSQRGIGIHQFREKGVFDFSYYPELSFPMSLSQIFMAGFKEYRFTFNFGENQFVGSVDFVYFGKNRILIVDYKSGKSMHNDLYKQQLIFYAESLSFIKKLDSTVTFDLIIDYVDQRKIERAAYKSVGPKLYFEKFMKEKELENVIS